MDQIDPQLGNEAPVGADGYGIAVGSRVLTLSGILPVEHLVPGDRIVTRNGARVLRGIGRLTLPEGAPVVAVSKDALGGRPDRDLWLPPHHPILVRDWRAQALWGVAQARVAVERLIDGEYVKWTRTTGPSTCVQLRFGTPEIYYADGLELASSDPLVELV